MRQLFAFQVGHRNVAAEVVNAVERHAPGRGIGLGGRGSHQQGTGQARSHGGGDGIRLFDARLIQRRLHDLRHGLKVGTGGDFRDDAAETRMLLHGGSNGVSDDLHVAVLAQLDDAHAGFIAGGLDTHDLHDCSLIFWAIGLTRAHHHVRIRPGRLVIVLADPLLGKAVALIQANSGIIAHANLEEDRGVLEIRDMADIVHHHPRDAAALRGGVDANGVDFKLRVRGRSHHADARIAQKLYGRRFFDRAFHPEIEVEGLGHFFPEDPAGPRSFAWKKDLFQLGAPGCIGRG